MNAQDLKKTRMALHFPTSEAAFWLGNKMSEGAWIALEESNAPEVPAEISERVISLCVWHQQTLENTARNLDAVSSDNLVTLVWYDTAEDWADTGHRLPMAFRPYQSVCSILQKRFYDRLVLQRFERDHYKSWLSRHKISEHRFSDERLIIRWATGLTDLLERGAANTVPC